MTDFPTLPNLPAYLADETSDVILARMLADMKAQGIDTVQGSFAYDAEAPGALELVQLKAQMRQILQRAFARYSFGAYLDHIAAQRAGINRNPAVAAQTILRFTGTAGTVIPTAAQVSTQLQPGATIAAVVFTPNTSVVIPAGGSVDVQGTCTVAGESGNVAATTLKVLVTPIAGVTAVTNPTAVGDGASDVKGAAVEDDGSFLARYEQAIQNPSGSGSANDYIRWSKEVTGVGDVYPVPLGYGPNTVRVVLTGSNKQPASASVVQAVEDHLYTPWRIVREAEALSTSGYGITQDSSQTDASGGSCIKMVYDVNGTGLVTDRLDLIPLPQAGIWTVKARLKVDSAAGASNLLQIGIYDLTTGAWAKTTPTGSTDAMVTLKASDLATAFADTALDYSWNGTDQLEFRCIRLQTDTTTTVWFDQARHQSVAQRVDKTPTAPCTARIYVEAAGGVTIAVSYHPVYATGAVPADADTAVKTNFQAYLSEFTLGKPGTVWWVRIGAEILKASGMQSYSNLLVNGGTADVPIAADEVPVLGTVTLT